MNLVDSILGSAAELPPFPAVIQRVLQLMDNPKSSAREVVEVIQYDQAITANVLRVCNSAYFSLRRPVHSLREALVRIGFNRWRLSSTGGAPTSSREFARDMI
jgi:HD-like signal output (HDOD) protein